MAVRRVQQKSDPPSVQRLSAHQRLMIPNVTKINAMYDRLSKGTDGLPVVDTLAAAIKSLPTPTTVRRRYHLTIDVRPKSA